MDSYTLLLVTVSALSGYGFALWSNGAYVVSSRKYYSIRYKPSLFSRWYTAIFPKHLHFKCIDRVTDDEGVDITEHVRAIMGPSEDFHGQRLKLDYIRPGSQAVTFHTVHGTTFTMQRTIDPVSFKTLKKMRE